MLFYFQCYSRGSLEEKTLWLVLLIKWIGFLIYASDPRVTVRVLLIFGVIVVI